MKKHFAVRACVETNILIRVHAKDEDAAMALAHAAAEDFAMDIDYSSARGVQVEDGGDVRILDCVEREKKI